MKTKAAACLLLFLSLGLGTEGARVLFTPGQEYTYSYEALVTTGTEEPTSFASSYKLIGVLRVQAENSNAVNVKLDDLSIGIYNGPWTFYPLPTFQISPAADLSSLSEPFQIQTENGKFKALVMNDQEPEWASNLKRGIATYLQMDMSLAEFDKVGLHKVQEATTMGECDTKYEVIPSTASKTGLTTISKFRNHADCSDVPTRTKFPTRIFYACHDQRTRNVLNSTAYATYVVDAASSAEALTVHHITVYSSVLYWPFTVTSPFMYTWLNLTIHLNNVGPIASPIAAVENPENHEDLSFVFEQNDLNDPEDEIQDFKSADPMYFHHTAGESDPEVLAGIMEELHITITEVADSIITTNSLLGDDLNKFHKNSLFAILRLVASLDYDSLKHCYEKYLQARGSGTQQATIEFQLFLDGLTAAGTWPSSLTIKDILLGTTDSLIIARLAPSFPHYIVNPTEALAKELDPIFELTKKSSLFKPLRRILQLSMASLISRACQKSLCTQTGLLAKYVTYFEGKLANKDNFEIQSLGVHGLRNIGIGNSLDKLLEIAEGSTDVPTSVRVQAIWSLRPLAFEENSNLFEKLLPVFYNRSEPCEIRTSVFSFLMSCKPEKRILHEIAYFMWTETCPQTANIVRSTLVNMAKSKNPCIGEIKSYAETILKYLPPGAVDPTRTTSYAIDYYDEEHGFGQETKVTVQKSGSTALPLTVYLGLNTYIGGYGASNLGIFIRLEGLGKTIGKKLAALRNADVDAIKNILGKIDVKTRPTTPLKLEVTLMYHGKTVLYFAADERTIDSLPQLLHRLGEIKSTYSFDFQRSILLGGALYQQPMEFGVPVSVTSVMAATVSVAMNDTRAKLEGLLTQDTSFKLQLNTFGVTRIANHFPGIDAAFGVQSKRTLRINAPRQILLGVDVKNQAIHVNVKPPTEADPLILIGHATTETTLTSDTVQGQGKVSKAQALLQQSCPACSASATVSKGQTSRRTRQRVITSGLLTGVKSTVNYFDCERDYSKGTLIQKMAHILNPANKNSGIFGSPVTKAILTAQQFRDAIFYSPSTETCGISVSLSQDSSKGQPLENIEGKITGTVEPSTATNPNFKLHLQVNVDLKYPSDPPLNLESYVNILYNELDQQELDIKGILRQANTQKAGIVCATIKQSSVFLPKDQLCYKGENKPQLKETLTLTLGQLTPGLYKGKNTPCLTSHVEVLINAEAHQSEEQVLEAKLNIPPYKNCRDQKSSPLYPGNFVPPTSDCFAAALEQTTLRAVNVSMNYKLHQIITKKLRRPLALVEGLLLPFALDEDEAPGDHSHENHVHPQDGQMDEGEVEFDLNMKRSGPTLDIHYHSRGKEQHFHGVDLNLIPEALRPRPVPSRFSPLVVLGLQLGAFGICSATPAVVSTFDGVTIPGALPECPTLVSADCGDKPQYAVLAKKTSDSTIAVVIYLGSNLIELDGTSMKLNGESVTLQNKIGQDLPLLSANSFNALRNNDEIYITSRFLALFVRYTGNFVTVSLGSRYRGSQCGLCGKWDSNPGNDFLGPDPTCGNILNPSQRVAAWVVREGECSTVGQACPA